MKKIMGLLSLSIALVAISCTDKPAETKKEIIVVPSGTTTIIKEPTPPATPPTKIVVNKNGAKVATKTVEVTVNKP